MTNFNRSATLFTLLLTCAASTAFGGDNQTGHAPAQRPEIEALPATCVRLVSSFLTKRDEGRVAKTSRKFHKTLSGLDLKVTWLEYQDKINREGRARLKTHLSQLVLPETILQNKNMLDLLHRAIFYNAIELTEDLNGMVPIKAETIKQLEEAVSNNFSIQQGVLRNNVFAVLKCLKAHANPNATIDEFASFALLPVAIIKNYTGIIRILLAHGANPNARCRRGTCLHMASEENRLDAAILLLNHPNFNSIDDQNDSGETALYRACMHGRTTIAKLLLKRGANPNIRNIEKMTALTIARGWSQQACVELLEK